MSISPIEHSKAVSQNEATTNMPPANNKTTKQEDQSQQDKVTISNTAKQASNQGNSKSSGAGDGNEAEHSH